MSHDAAADLAAWIPRLIAAYRARSSKRVDPAAPKDALTPSERKTVAAGVKALSLGLTRERELAGAAYMDDPKLLGAYLLFYWPVSYAQARAVLGELPRRPGSVLDLGAGPGPMTFAALDAGAREAVAADRSLKALDLARTLAIAAGESLATREWQPEKPAPDGRFDLICLGHVLNELFKGDLARRAQLLSSLASKVKTGGSLVVVEPALKETSRALLGVRDVLVAQGFAVRAPCFFRGPCPALVKPTDWCHAERPWKLPPLVESVAKEAGLHKDALKMSYLVLAPPGETWAEPPPGRIFRIVSEPLQGKGRLRFMGCGPEGRIGLALQERHKAAHNAAFFNLRRGDVVAIGEVEEKGDGLGLAERSTVTVVSPAGRGR